MDGKFFVPIATMLAGVVVFVAFALCNAVAGKSIAVSPWPVAGACLVAGGLIVFSGFS
jgi:fatty acid desaturase